MLRRPGHEAADLLINDISLKSEMKICISNMKHASEDAHEVTIYLLQICERLTWQRKGVTLLEIKT